jgi:ribosomal protein L4
MANFSGFPEQNRLTISRISSTAKVSGEVVAGRKSRFFQDKITQKPLRLAAASALQDAAVESIGQSLKFGPSTGY